MISQGIQQGIEVGIQAGPNPGARTDILPELVAENSSTSNVDSYVFAESAEPAANTLLLMAVACAHSSAAEVPDSIDAYGLTWTEAPDSSITYSSGARRLTWFYAWGEPTEGTVTIGFATGHTYCIYAVIACVGARLAAPRQAITATATGTTVTGTLAELAYGANMSIYAVLHNASEAAAPPAEGDWTELSDRTVATPAGAMEIAWTVSGDLTANPTWSTSAVCGISIMEIEAG